MLQLNSLEPRLQTEYERWTAQIGSDDPYRSSETLGIPIHFCERCSILRNRVPENLWGEDASEAIYGEASGWGRSDGICRGQRPPHAFCHATSAKLRSRKIAA